MDFTSLLTNPTGLLSLLKPGPMIQKIEAGAEILSTALPDMVSAAQEWCKRQDEQMIQITFAIGPEGLRLKVEGSSGVYLDNAITDSETAKATGQELVTLFSPDEEEAE